MYTERRLPSGAVLWQSTGGSSTVIPADGCVDVIVLNGVLTVAGPSTRALTTRPDGPEGSLGIRFAPGQAGSLLAVPLAEVADRLVPLEAVQSPGRSAPLSRVMLTLLDGCRAANEIPRDVDVLAMIEPPQEADRAWRIVVRRWAAQHVATSLVAERLGISGRTLRRRMTDSFGYGYPTLSRIERARQARRLLSRGASPSEAAAATGYADQPHLTREFRRLVGRSPGQVADGAKKSIELPSGSRNVAYR